VAALVASAALAGGCGGAGGAGTTGTDGKASTVDLACAPLDADCRTTQRYLNEALAKVPRLDADKLLASKDIRYLRAAAPACRRLDRALREAGLTAPDGGRRAATLARAAAAYARASGELAAVPPPTDRAAETRSMIRSYRELAGLYRQATAAVHRPATFTVRIERARIVAATAGGGALAIGLPCPAVV
jgi:hypothetical protein